MKKKGISFKQIFDLCSKGDHRELAKITPVHEVVLDASVHHHPNPLEAQPYRIPVIWKGDIDSEVGKSMIKCDPNGPLAFMVTKIVVDPHAGEVAVGRIYSGTLRRSDKAYLAGSEKEYTLQQVALIMGADRLRVEMVVSGNIAACQGVKDAAAGNTISSTSETSPFEKIVHYTEPVVTVAIEAKHMRDLPKLIEVLRSLAKADPSLRVEINQETGEHLLSGMGELHLEITQYRIKEEQKVDITASPPIVVYRECVAKRGGPFEGKSPNKHNRFYVEVEPIEDAVLKAIKDGEIPSDERIKDAKALQKKLQDLGMGRDEARSVVWIGGQNMLIDMTKGIQYLNETMELIKDAFDEAINRGPLANEKLAGVKVRLVDAKLHEDSIHRGPAQVIPAARAAIYGAMCQGQRILREPVQKVFINVPQDLMGPVTTQMQQRRGVIEDIQQEGDITTVIARAPVAELFGFANSMRGATQGRALWSTENAGFQAVPRDILPEVVKKIRTRKGLNPDPYNEDYYAA
jgi:elongation factor 2